MEDHHVDRPGVKAQQCVELTGPNSSIGLISSLPRAVLSPFETLLDREERAAREFSDQIRKSTGHTADRGVCLLQILLDDLVILAGGVPPDPIPNSAVKTSSAHGTAS